MINLSGVKVIITSQIRQDGHVHELQWKRSVKSSSIICNIHNFTLFLWSRSDNLPLKSTKLTSPKIWKIQNFTFIFYSQKFYLYVVTKLLSSSCDIFYHNFCRAAFSLLFHFLHFHHWSISGTLLWHLTDPALLVHHLWQDPIASKAKKSVRNQLFHVSCTKTKKSRKLMKLQQQHVILN